MPSVEFLKLFVRRKARTLSTGEKIVEVCLFLRLLVFVPAILVVLYILTHEPSNAPREETKPVHIAAAAAMVSVYLYGIVSIWWQRLTWTGGALSLRSVFQKVKWYEWDDCKGIAGSQHTWKLEMTDGRRFRGNDWSNGAAEFLDVVRARTGIVLPEY
jgi:hypothetical protein